MRRRSRKRRRSTQSRDRLKCVGPVLMGVAMAGVATLPTPSKSSEIVWPRTSGATLVLRTGGAVVEAWAFGTLSEATQPNSQEACDLSHVCWLANSSDGGAGTGTGATIKTFFESPAQGELQPNLPFTLTEAIDYAHPTSRTGHRDRDDGGGNCYPGSAVMKIAVDTSSTLVLDIVGQACQVGSDPARLVFTGSYVSDAASSGEFANSDGIGSVNINNPSGLSGTGSNMKASLTGQLEYGD